VTTRVVVVIVILFVISGVDFPVHGERESPITTVISTEKRLRTSLTSWEAEEIASHVIFWRDHER
jgi:hypothetical protein